MLLPVRPSRATFPLARSPWHVHARRRSRAGPTDEN